MHASHIPKLHKTLVRVCGPFFFYDFFKQNRKHSCIWYTIHVAYLRRYTLFIYRTLYLSYIVICRIFIVRWYYYYRMDHISDCKCTFSVTHPRPCKAYGLERILFVQSHHFIMMIRRSLSDIQAVRKCIIVTYAQQQYIMMMTISQRLHDFPHDQWKSTQQIA